MRAASRGIERMRAAASTSAPGRPRSSSSAPAAPSRPSPTPAAGCRSRAASRSTSPDPPRTRPACRDIQCGRERARTSRPHRKPAVLLISVILLAAAATYSYAQYDGGFFNAFRGGLRGEQGDPAELPPAQMPDGNFTACHILYTSVRREAAGAGWRTDYPWGERHLLMRLAELTKTHVSLADGGKTPHSWLVRLTDDALFGCPYLMASDVGTIGLSEAEAARLRLYLEKG